MSYLDRKQTKWIQVLALIVIAVLGAGMLYMVTGRSVNAPGPIYAIEDDWDIVYRGEKLPERDLEDVLFTGTKRGETIDLSCSLPENIQVEDPTLSLYSVNSVVAISIDDQQIYAYGQEDYEKGKLVGYGYHFVKLPLDFVGKQLKIHFLFTEDDAITSIYQVRVGSGYDIYHNMLVQGRVSLAISLFLMIFGVIMLILGGLIHVQNHSIMNICCVAIMSISIGCWTFCNHDLITLFTDDLRCKIYLEYMNLYFFVIPFVAYFAKLVYEKNTPKWIKIIYGVVLYGQLGLLAVILLLNGFNIVHLPRFLSLGHAVMGFSILFMIVFLLDRVRRKEAVKIKIVLGFSVAVGFGCFELIRYNLCRYLWGFQGDGSGKSSIDIAAMIVVLTLFWDYFSRSSDLLQEETKQKVLMEMAYKDELTGLANRRKFDDELRELFTGGKPFAVVSLDMNHLKKINDTFGHKSGDDALKRFAALLRKAFSEGIVIGRCGGDEFNVLLPTTDRDTVQAYMDQFLQKMDAENHRHTIHDIPLSSAYGVAYSDECDAVHSLMALADQRMYENKRKSRIGRDFSKEE